VSGALPGRVEQLYVEEGDTVAQGDTLVRIHSSLADAKLQQAEALRDVARTTNRKVDAGTRPQIVSATRDLWQQAEAARRIAETTYRRMQNLCDKGVVSLQKRDEALAAFQAASSAASAAKSQYDLALAGAQSEDRQAARDMVKVAQGGVAEVDALLQDSYLLAPCPGIVTEIYPHESELVAIGAPVMTIEKADRYAVFNVREDMLAQLPRGSVVRVKIPALKQQSLMRVYYVKDMGSYANWQATKATGDYDARTFEVKVRPEEPVEGLLPGMSVIYLSTESLPAASNSK
jgi:HlyD family secretion protein